MSEFGRFFLPGPTEVRPEVLRALTRPLIGHRGSEMVALMERILPRLSRVFRTRRPVWVSTSSATGLMEAAIRNCVRRRCLCLVNGAFGDRFYRIALACGKEADRLEVPWGAAHDPDAVAEAVRGRGYDAVTVVHSETSTGVLNPVAEIAEAVRSADPGALVLVDAVSSLAGAPLETDAWGLDVVLTGAQKALALPPGLAFAAASERALARAAEVPDRGVYFDFLAFERSAEERQTTNTPAISLLYALDVQLERIEAEGLERRWARHRAMAERTAAWAEGAAERVGVRLEVQAPPGRRSPTVTSLRCSGGWAGPEVVRRARARGYVIGGGYGAWKEASFRIGHMGDHTLEELEACLAVLDEILREGP
jgi:predicted phosphoserine aminotransferase